MHPVVHVSQLKRHVPYNTPVSASLAALASAHPVPIVPEQILKKALIPHGSATPSRTPTSLGAAVIKRLMPIIIQVAIIPLIHTFMGSTRNTF